MKMIHITRWFFMIAVMLQVSCIKDKSNYQFEAGNPVKITYPENPVLAVIDEPLTIIPNREFQVAGKTMDDYDHEWYLEGRLISKDPTLTFKGTRSGTFLLQYNMVDKATGVRHGLNTGIYLHVISPYETGWDILYEKDGESEIAHVRATSTGYKDQLGLYKEKNNGESLGSMPMRIKDYQVNGGRGLAIIQQGGQGPVELDGFTFEKRLVMKESFVGGVPAGLKPVNIGFYESSDMMLSEDGKLYPRLFQANPIAFTVPWLNIPVQTKYPMKITHLWDVWAINTYYTFMYDELNNRLHYVLLKGIATITPGNPGGMLQIDTVPAPASYFPVPPGYINPSNPLTGYSYIWGSTFRDDQGFTTSPAFLVKEQATGDVYVQSFSFTSIFGIQTIHMPGAKRLFSGQQYLNAASKFVAIKTRNFLFFSGDADNQGLYYYDVSIGGATKLYDHLPSPITVLRQSDDGQQLAVGTADGVVIFYDISNQTMLSGGPVELHRVSGMGRIADITVRGGYQL
jgi:hypothetical protein